MRAKSNSPSPAQRQVQAAAPKSKFLSVASLIGVNVMIGSHVGLVEAESIEDNRCQDFEWNNVCEARNSLRRVALILDLAQATAQRTAFTRAALMNG
jgi:hypothetical protein